MNKKANSPLQSRPIYPGEEEDLLDIPIIRQSIQAAMPELLKKSAESEMILDRIQEYLFEQPYLKATKLKPLVTHELYLSLRGLKKLLQRHHLNFINLCLDEHKKQFGKWLKEELSDEA